MYILINLLRTSHNYSRINFMDNIKFEIFIVPVTFIIRLDSVKLLILNKFKESICNILYIYIFLLHI